MENKLLIYIVAYERMSYTQGTIECLHKNKPPNSQIIVCDNGSTDGTREWLELNQTKYNLGLIFPEENLRVGGAWTLLTNYYNENDFDYILLLDNDGWVLPKEKDWYEQCVELFNSDPKIGSLGLQKEIKPGYFSMGKTFDLNFNKKIPFNKFECYDTVFFAAFRLDNFKLWYNTMSNWPHKFIGDKIGRHYNQMGFRTIKINPGFIVDASEYNFDNKEHREYNIDFHQKERDDVEFKRRIEMHSTNKNMQTYIIDNFGEEFLKFL
jgi:glycosyltransferase involved in cell wall biosynthesis|tara:strand:- start:6843 stop:7640 length:798 start_codon:yes stop_codon:yes gene_type:complete